MYNVDHRDRVRPLEGVPQSSVGAPIPHLLADESVAFLAYYVEARDPGWDGTTVRVVGPDSDGETTAIVKFRGLVATMFGPPNDEAYSGHPLASRGLQPYGAYVIDDSSWVRRLARMNSVHPQHRDEHFARLKHFVFAFHDSTFECVADEFEIVLRPGSVRSAIDWMRDQMG